MHAIDDGVYCYKWNPNYFSRMSAEKSSESGFIDLGIVWNSSHDDALEAKMVIMARKGCLYVASW